jgi:protein TonB
MVVSSGTYPARVCQGLSAVGAFAALWLLQVLASALLPNTAPVSVAVPVGVNLVSPQFQPVSESTAENSTANESPSQVSPPVQQALAVPTREKSSAQPSRHRSPPAPRRARREAQQRQQREPVSQASPQESEVANAVAAHHQTQNQASTPTALAEAEVVERRAPRYPRRAVELGMQGMVVLHVLIDSGGALRDVKVAESSGFGMLDKAALAAVSRWRFAPGPMQGQWMRVPIEFLLN